MAAATQREKDKNNPKPKSAENAAMAMQRGAEKVVNMHQKNSYMETKIIIINHAYFHTTIQISNTPLIP